MEHRSVSLSAYWRLLRFNRNFRRLWLAQIVSEMGDWIYVIAVYTLLLEATGSAKSVALALVLQTLPQVVTAPMAGVLNDRLSRRHVMIAADIGRAAVVLGMLFAGRAGLVPLIYVLLLLETVMWAFFEPGRSATVPNLVPRDELVAANGLSSITWSVNLMLGSGVGGVLAAFLGRDAVFILNSLSFLLSAAFLAGMHFTEPHTHGSAPLRPRDLADFTPIAEGIRYLLSDRRLIALLLVKAGVGIMGANWVLLPIFGERIFPVTLGRLDAQRAAMLGMSALMSSRGLGAILGPLVSGYWAGARHARLRTGILAGFLLGGLGYVALGAAPVVWAAWAAVAVAHAGGSICWVFSTTLLHFHTEDRFRGRAFSADFAFLVTTMSLSSWVAGSLIDRGFTARSLAAATGLATLVAGLVWIFAMRSWRARQGA
jgi:MFS family permease